MSRNLGISALYLMKPRAAHDELRESIVSALTVQTADRGKDSRVLELEDSSGLSPARHPRGLRLLLTEDNIVNQRVAVRILEKAGYSVVTANDGREALEALQAQEFDLVLMDVQMPEMDGLEATTAIRLKEKVTGDHIPIVAMTAHAMKGDETRCLAAGMDGYISKPIRARDLIELVEKHAQENATRGRFDGSVIAV